MTAPRNAQYRHLDVQKFAGGLGADVRGADLSRGASDDALATIRTPLLDNLVICIRDRDITLPHQPAGARRSEVWGDRPF